MMWRILKKLILAIILSLIALWLWSGGFSAIAHVARVSPAFWENPLAFAEMFRLPWQDQVLLPEVESTVTGEREIDYALPTGADATLYGLEQEYADLADAAEFIRLYGEPSPFRGTIVLGKAGAQESDLKREYLVIEARYDKTEPVLVSGWTLLGLGGGAGRLPKAASPFIGGVVNQEQEVRLAAGQYAIVASGPSPVGISFRENTCTGYLEQLQAFEPPLMNSCPRAEDVAPLNAENLRRYGSECMDYIRTIPQCTFPREMPSLSSACRSFIVNTFSYNGCVNMSQVNPDFSFAVWRLYLGRPSELWNNTHDVIRLLDQNGLTVDALVY